VSFEEERESERQKSVSEKREGFVYDLRGREKATQHVYV